MSTSDAFINIGAANLARDIPESLGMEYDSDRQELWVNRLGSAAIIVLSLFLAYFVQILVGILGVVGWALFAAPIVPLLGIGLNWSGATREGALAAVVVSLLVNLGLAVGSSLYGVSLPHGVVAGAFSLVASSITLIVVSLLTNTYSGEDIAEEIYRVVVA
jgi:sodium/proline symporter